MTSHSNDGSGNQTNGDNSGGAPSETDSLLEKQELGERSAATDTTEAAEAADTQTFLETIVEGVEYIAEQAQEAAAELKDAFVEGAHEVAHDMAEAAHDIADAIVEEAQDVKDHLVDNLVEKDDGNAVMFEMQLTRNLSMLPSDIEEWAHPKPVVLVETGTEQEEPITMSAELKHDLNFCPQKIQNCCRPTVAPAPQIVDEEGQPLFVEGEKVPDTTTGIPFHAYVTLVGAVICLSSIGPSLDMQNGVDSSMKVYWRMSGTSMILSPLALRSVLYMGLPGLTRTQWCTFVLAAFCYGAMCVCFVLALDFTSVGNAVIFSNSQSILLLVGKLLVGEPIQMIEGIGALTAFFGGAMCACDSSASTGNNVFDTDAPVVWAGWGDLLALLSAIGGVGYLVLAKTLREHVPSVFLFMFMIMFAGELCVLAFLWISGVHFTLDRDVNHGLWGWMNLQPDRFPLEIWMVCVCNIMGAMGYVRSMAYFDNLIISVATLMEPVVASLMAYFLQVGLLPNAVGWVGNFLVAAGTVAVIYPNSHGKQVTGGH